MACFYQGDDFGLTAQTPSDAAFARRRDFPTRAPGEPPQMQAIWLQNMCCSGVSLSSVPLGVHKILDVPKLKKHPCFADIQISIHHASSAKKSIQKQFFLPVFLYQSSWTPSRLTTLPMICYRTLHGCHRLSLAH